MKRVWKLLPILILLVAAGAASTLVLTKPKPEKREFEAVVPVIDVHTVELTDHRLTVMSQGTVSPRTESVLVPEVAGRVIEVSPSFAPGGFFEAGELLLRIDPHDYRQALVGAQSNEARARLRLAQVEAEAELAREEWEELGDGEANPLTLFEPQLAEARAALAAAIAGVEQARTNVGRTELRAPYAGRVQTKQVDLGQVVAPGTPLATIYAVDLAEVRLPLPDDELAYVDLPLGYRGESGSGDGPSAILRAEFAGAVHEWRGRIVRTEGMIDPVSRMVHTVVQVEDPYGRSEPGRPPLAAGMFVEAEIDGRTIENVAVIPRAAVRPDGRILVVDAEGRLRFREVDVLRALKETVIVEHGLQAGERVCTTPLSSVVEGMKVAVRGEGA
ncbi:MAG: efflux RND transporter periplasmic adaptor subunit [Acidobacteria bacterium]|nr:efflux RND transporter periplasmic adaptor subunit [Acidobacteriota bacterium]NIM62318.1 efflux RND transporter periplasmic adaptor subunit [Acidobacteriota bacterium]NIO60651.1 efflux RND transporter periplasmic adaptor subunit [Acidobacteriota bacterium]NIQ85084.1 efflux RND transporter periplasmic adaptor subunit [Acidobacteriota bacterium]NIT12295.1 efflux RND transporter periplasmic adaptor subunit [Acidobacteriota bacterium]